MELPKEIFEQHIAVLGKTGSGKSSALRYMVESHLMRHGKRVCIIDPKGDWWGLKVAAAAPGLPFVLFGDFKNDKASDVPINDRSGKTIASLVAGGNRPCVIGMRGWTQGAMTRFWIDFASTLFAKNAGELYLVGDEFHNFAPKQWKGQADKDTPVGVALHWSNRLLSEGRGLGLVCLIASQRPQKVHNDTLTSCETLVAMRVIHAADRAAVKAWIDGNGDASVAGEVLNSLAGMSRGEAWVWSPEIDFGPKRLTFPMFRTFDSFAPPQTQKRVSSKSWADVNLSEVKAALENEVKEAELNDPSALKKQIADLKRQVAAKPVPAADPKAVERAVAVAAAERDRFWKPQLLESEKHRKTAVTKLQRIHRESTLNGDATISVEQPKIIGITTPKIPARQLSYAAPKTSARTIRQDQPTDCGEFKFGKAEQSILRAFYWTRDGESTPAKIGFYSGYSHKSGSFANTISRLRSAGLVESWSITDAGVAMAAEYAEAKPSGLELREWLRPKISKCENEILDTLMEAGGNRLSPEQIAAATPSQYSHGSGSFANALARLRSLEAAEGYGGQGVKAADVFFE